MVAVIGSVCRGFRLIHMAYSEAPLHHRGRRRTAAQDPARCPLRAAEEAASKWISWRETTAGSPPSPACWALRAAAIARAAAIPPAIVVMHGIPCAIAAERIS